MKIKDVVETIGTKYKLGDLHADAFDDGRPSGAIKEERER